jgi:hypothetical protein
MAIGRPRFKSRLGDFGTVSYKLFNPIMDIEEISFKSLMLILDPE